MINPSTKYPGRVTVTSDYPNGEAINRTTPDTGTPLEKEWLNDWFGFQQAVISEAGLTASGTADNANTCQLLEGLDFRINKIYNNITTITTSSYSAQNSDEFLNITVGSVITLPSSPPNGKKLFFFKNITQEVSVVGQNSSFPYYGTSGAKITIPYGLSAICYNGTQWVDILPNQVFDKLTMVNGASNIDLTWQTKYLLIDSGFTGSATIGLFVDNYKERTSRVIISSESSATVAIYKTPINNGTPVFIGNVDNTGYSTNIYECLHDDIYLSLQY